MRARRFIAGICPWGPAQQVFQINVLPPLVKSPWRLYVGPFAVTAGQRIQAKAIRYGYAESAQVARRF